ncbi:inositol monophosphatase [Legionella birminghamensis]|uniref:3'(2'),5'-bisphosphate nucleotidase CysQ n=1 Tax=Legionella birminghamensis TaxID=28083 RepID=A0A378I4Z5_9GAMM|nr:3'(2'),5'-bisphosphate nucleotidase CysQ [Legionella birminghamensis]KTC68746.1 inositol monophosphatase [Legionella birminghamensis]STX30268.1 inositol monophosphatase [Legionella birminghamensis]
MSHVDIQEIINLSSQAANAILRVYQKMELTSTVKTDKTPLTEADQISHDIITAGLKSLYPHIPIISEESSTNMEYETRKRFDFFFLVDPLDGTKEFLNRNGEFTINIALIHKDSPVLGVVHAPVSKSIYYAEKGRGAFKINNQLQTQLVAKNNLKDTITITLSRSHQCPATAEYLEKLNRDGNSFQLITAGSALKFALLAEGKADVYPRFSPTMEWDTAAGHAILLETGKQITEIGTARTLKYNKRELVNPGFIAA